MAVVKVQITGLEQILSRVRALKEGSKTVTRQAVTKGAQVVAKALKKRVPVGKYLSRNNKGKIVALKLLQKSIGYKVKTYRGKAVAVIGARVGYRAQMGVRTRGRNKGAAWFQDPSNIAHLVDQGHGGPHPAGGKFFRAQTLNDAENDASEAMRAALEQGLEKLASGQ